MFFFIKLCIFAPMIIKLLHKSLTSFGKFIMLMGRTFRRPERLRMFAKEYIKEMAQLGVNSIGIVLLISFFIGAVICIQMKLNIQSPWMQPVDAALGQWLHHPRNHAVGVLQQYHVSDSGW